MSDAESLFAHAPMALLLEDLSGLKRIFDGWRAQGVADLEAFLAGRPELLRHCAASIRTLAANRAALALFGVNDREHLLASLPVLIRDEALPAYAGELLQLWRGDSRFATRTVNYTLSGARLDIKLNGAIMPGAEADWSRVLIALEDITEGEQAARALKRSESYALSLFHDSPVSLWVEDFSAIKQLLDGLRRRGITDFQTFIDVHPDFVERCMAEVRVIDVNRHTLQLFGAADRDTLLVRLSDVMRDEMHRHFGHQLIEMWEGRLRYEREVVNYRLDGEPLHLILQFSVMPGFEHDWSMVLISLTDITARKKAEAYLEYLGKHDVLTGLHNRAFYNDEINRLERKGPFPVSVIVADLNGIKLVNDELGHAAGDAVLRRAGEILSQAVDRPGTVARTGGDEFVILLAGAGPEVLAQLQLQIEQLTELNNQFHSSLPPVVFSMGGATAAPGERVEVAIQRADARMYEAKRAFYETSPTMDRRRALT